MSKEKKKSAHPTCNFGEHVMLDGYKGDAERLNDKKVVAKCLNELPKLLGMKKLSKPEVYFTKGNDKLDPGGWSGFVVIAESHISVHTFPAKGFVSVDAYTCKSGMDRKFIANYFKKMFGLRAIELQFAKRGTKFPVCNIY